jgi:predicted signal transduction protein with EAL and GGDEF domain
VRRRRCPLDVDRVITVSIGVADLIQHGGDAQGLLRQADRALYTAKATGRNRVVVAGAEESTSENGRTDEAIIDDDRPRERSTTHAPLDTEENSLPAVLDR